MKQISGNSAELLVIFITNFYDKRNFKLVYLELVLIKKRWDLDDIRTYYVSYALGFTPLIALTKLFERN